MSYVAVVIDVSDVGVGTVEVVIVVLIAVEVSMWLLILEVVYVVVVEVSNMLLVFGQPLKMSYLCPPKVPFLYMHPF